MKNKCISRALSLTLLCALLVQLCVPMLAAEDGDTVCLSSERDLYVFAECCAYDAWSEGKTVVLQCDIALGGVDFRPIASFGGTFEGNGHTISGLNVSSSVSPAGLFGTVAETGVVRGLKVEGSVAPGGSADIVGGVVGVNRGTVTDCSFTGMVSGEKRTGGVAGENAATGTLRRCTVDGGVFGKNMTGGVVGANHGTASLCVNHAYVNTRTLDPSVSFERFDWNAASGLSALASPDVYNITVDSGGVAGFSDGALLGCTNYGSVGYQHIGYNVGGVVGRSSGHAASCTNEGAVCGRREVGGVVGMAEPYIKIAMDESSLESVRRELNTLNALIAGTLDDAQSASDTVSARLTKIGQSVDAAEDSARDLSEQLGGYWDDTVREIDRGSEIADVTIRQLGGVSEELTTAADTLTKALDQLEKTVEAADRSGAAEELTAMAEDLRAAAEGIDVGMRQVSRGLAALGRIVGPREGLDEAAWREGVYGAGGALEQIQSGAAQSSAALARLTAALNGLAEGVRDGTLTTPEQVAAYLDEHQTDADLTAIGEGFRLAAEGSAWILENTELDGAAARDGLALIRAGAETLAYGMNGQGSPMQNVGSALAHFANAVRAFDGVTDELEQTILLFRDASNEAGGALSKADRLLAYLRGQDRLNLEPLGEGTEAAANGLYGSVRDISDNLELLNRETKAAADKVLDDVRRINSQFAVLMDTLLDVVEKAETGSVASVVSDTSDEDVDAVVSGKLLLCGNSGEVSGDIDVGGVAGAMMIYNALDPENDEEDTAGSAVRRRYELKCVLQGCVNTGAVTGKRDNVGAVCGNAAFGAISECEAYGSAESEGSCVGGIAGFADNTVRKCWSRCTLAGEKYVGGIVGGGRAERSNLTVEGCRALVEVTRSAQYAGSILGADAGRISGNLFVSDTLPGVDRVSERGRAEPVGYERLLAEPGLPMAFRSFTLRFVANGETVRETDFNYGASFGAEDFPEIPAVEGQFARWDRTELSNLRFDTTVTAIYEPRLSALDSGITRSASRPTFFVEGAFDDAAALEASPAVFDFDGGRHGLLSRLRSYRRTLLEQWQLTLPDDGAATHTVRYLPPEGVSDHLVLYTLENGAWRQIETGSFGSYLTFETAGRELSLAVVSTATPWWVWTLVGGFLLACAALLAALLIRKKPKQALTDEEKARELKRKKRRRGVRIVLIAMALSLGAAAGAILYLAPGLTEGVELYMLLHNYAERTDVDMTVSLAAQVEGRAFDADVDFFATEYEGKRVSCVRWQDIPLYYCDGAMLLENGKTYRADGVLPDYTGLLRHVAGLYRSVEVTANESNGMKTYHAVARGEAAQAVLASLLPGAAPALSDTESVALDLVMSDGEPRGLYIEWSGANGEARAELHRSAAERDHTLPQEVRTALSSGAHQNAEAISPEFKRLLLACTALATSDPISADAKLAANCGPLLLDESLVWQRTMRDGKQLSCISHNGARVYFTDGAACRSNGLPLLAGETLSDIGPLLRLAYEILLLGDAAYTDVTEGWHCTVTLDAKQMLRLTEAIAPEADDLGFVPQEGTLRLDAAKDGVTGVAVQCKGAVRVMGADVPATVSARLEFRKDAEFFTPSDKVLSVLGLD